MTISSKFVKKYKTILIRYSFCLPSASILVKQRAKSAEKINMTRLKKISPVFFLSLFAACSHAPPKGKVVRLDTQTAAIESAPAPVQDTLPTHTQAAHDSVGVPAQKDDAAVHYFSLAQAYSLDNDSVKAVEAYRATLVYDPKSALVRARLAAELIKQGNLAEARSLCEEAIKLDPKYPDSYLLLAGVEVAAKEYVAALETYRKVLKQEPKNKDALLYYGVTLAETGKTAEAVKVLENLVAIKDTEESSVDQAVGYFYLAKVQAQAGHLDSAIAALEQSLKKRPGFTKAALLEADFYMTKHNAKKARAVLETSFEESRQPELAERLAEIHLEANDYKGAVLYLETLAEADPANENVRLRLALVYWQLSWLEKARLSLLDLHDRFPVSSEINFYLGEIEMDLKKPDSALAYYKEVSPDFAKYEMVVSRVVAIYRGAKDFTLAEKTLRDAMAKRADLVGLYPMLGAIYEDQNKLVLARDALEEGRKVFPKDESILYYLGFLYDRLGDKKNSFALMSKILETNPDNVNALNFVGYSLLEKGEELAKAEGYLKRAFELKPSDPFILDSYGWLLYREGKQKQAMVYLEKAYSLRPTEAVIAEHLADTYVALHLTQKALLVYQKALGVDSDEEGFRNRVQVKVQNLESAMADSEPVARVPASAH